MRKIYLILAALLCGMAMNAATVYCKMSQEWWTKDGAAIGAYAWGTEGSNAEWPGVRMTPVEGQANLWKMEIDAAKYPNIIFTRMNPNDGDNQDWGAKTVDLTIPTDGKNLFTITTSNAVWGDPGCDGEWSVYTPGDDPVTPPTPQPGGAKDYYLKGYRGPTQGDITTPTAEEFFESGILADYSFEGDAQGKGYFFILVCEPGAVVGDCYMAAAYSEDTHITLSKQDGSHAEKMGVPAGTVTFYLYDNGDGTLELSTQPMPGKTLVGGGQGVENTFVNEKAHKMIIDGQLRIIRGDKMFDATGRQL